MPYIKKRYYYPTHIGVERVHVEAKEQKKKEQSSKKTAQKVNR